MNERIRTLPFHTQAYQSRTYGDDRIDAYLTTPAKGISDNTGILLLLHGWGNNGQEAYADDSLIYADRYDLLVVRVEYRHSGREMRLAGHELPVTQPTTYEIPYDCSKLQTVDCLRALAAAFDAFPAIRRDRIVLWGGSQGAMLTAQCLVFAPRTFSLAILVAGAFHPTSRDDVLHKGYSLDVRSADGTQVGFEEHALGPGRRFSDAEREIRSPFLHADLMPGNIPLHLIHGVADNTCDIRNTTRLYSLLRRHGKTAFFHPITGGNHGLEGAAPDEDTRLKATLKYVPDADWQVHRNLADDFTFDHDLPVITSGGTFRMQYRAGIPTLLEP